MRLGVIWQPGANAQYRAFQPMRAMAQRGHTVVWPPSEQGEADLERLIGCDLVHVYRGGGESRVRGVLTELVARGVPYSFDNDDDFTAVPKEAPGYRTLGGLQGHRHFVALLKLARMARVFTTTTEVLAEKHRRAGIPWVEVIGNYLVPDAHRPRVPHEGIVIGWIAGSEHKADAKGLRLAETLRALIEARPEVRVECIGVDLRLPERYRHDADVEFEDLPGRIGGFDIGIAPLIDLPINRARSDIKVKEYAASGVPWLASPIGPYIDLGEKQGGRLVPDDQWFDALDALVTDARARKQLGERGRRWAKGQTMEAAADRWESVFAAAAGRAPATAERPGRRPVVRLRPGHAGLRSRPGRS